MGEVAVLEQRSITQIMASRFMMDPASFEKTLRATVMKVSKGSSPPSQEEFAAFLLVAHEYNLNPLTKEIYAFPAKGGGITPIVSIDGWSNLINSNPQFDGMEFEDDKDDKGNISSITCRMYRKDRSRPISASEYLAECDKGTEPWRKWPRRMLRHKAMIQAARYAFGFSGIYEEDEAERIHEAQTPKQSNLKVQLEQRTQAQLEGAKEGFSQAQQVIDGEIGAAKSESKGASILALMDQNALTTCNEGQLQLVNFLADELSICLTKSDATGIFQEHNDSIREAGNDAFSDFCEQLVQARISQIEAN
ncbi:phage recombination protein Bet [Flexibacterium corallicola]|uniref:phage recombination protein Bet n=1 Tax=Flexibacterium corallicola TaxID=3037259 RepID=UPI00286EE665|nr:phage recombination protein Bet [Pseudovibrio sp. M1P-2-3]